MTAPPAHPQSAAGLRSHPLNARLYGATPELDDEFLASVRDLGILVPLTVLPDRTVVSGHRRLAAAQRLGLDRVPTVPYPGDPTDETELLAAIIAYNRQRVKTAEQLAREVVAMLDVETERARRRQAHGQTSPGRTLVHHGSAQAFPEPEPKSRAVVSASMGLGVNQVQQAAAIIKGIDRLVEQGDYTGAEQVRKALNERGLLPAYREIRKGRGQAAGPIHDPDGPREKRNAIPHDPIRAGEVIRKNFSRAFAAGLLAELQRLLREDWA